MIEELKKLAFEKLHEIYGDNVHEEIKNQLTSEIDLIENPDYQLLCMLARELMIQAEKEKNPTILHFNSGKPLLSFLLGISNINPLKAHYLCEKCHNFEFIPNINFGIDAEDKKCHVCNSLYKKDGYNLQYSQILGSIREYVSIYFHTTSKKQIFEYLVEKYGYDKIVIKKDFYFNEDGFFFIPDSKNEIFNHTDITHEYGIPMLQYNKQGLPDDVIYIAVNDDKNLMLLSKLDEKFGYPDISLNNPNIFTSEILNEILDTDNEKFINLWNKLNPKSFSDIVRYFGFSYATGCYNEKLPLEELISDRDELIIKLLEHGIEKNEAFKITENIRKGRTFAVNMDVLKAYGLSDNSIEQLSTIKYLGERTTTIHNAKKAVKLAYYRQHHKIGYYTEFLNTYCNNLKHLNYDTACKFVDDLDNLPDPDYELLDDYRLMSIVIVIHEKGIEIKVDNPDLEGFKFIEDGNCIKVV